MKRKLMFVFLILIVSALVSCDNPFSPATPELEGWVTRNPYTNEVTGYNMRIVNIHDVSSSYGGPVFYTLYYVQGEYSEIPDIEPVERPVLECPASGEFGYNNSTLHGKYTFWIVGSEDTDEMVNETDPSNLLVLDFGD